MEGSPQAAALSGAKWLIVSNVFQKICTFAINQGGRMSYDKNVWCGVLIFAAVIIRQSSPEIFGIAAVQLELLLSTLLFLSREGIRLALLRVISTDPISKHQCINLSWIPAAVVCIFTAALYVLCPTVIGGMSRDVVLLYCLGALFESVGEPWFNSYNRSFQFGPRVKADALAVTARSIGTYVAVVYLNMGVRGFGIAQLFYGVSHCAVMVMHQRRVCGGSSSIRDFLPCLPPTTGDDSPSMYAIVDNIVGWTTAKDALLMTGTSVLKHLLTEADKIALTLTASHYDQGVYAVTHNYGSLVVRLFFMPLEETCRVAFSRMAAAVAAEAVSDDATAEGSVARCEGAIRAEMADMLRSVLKVVVLFGVVFPLFGPAFARLAVKVALGQRWYSDETVLAISAFCFYIFVMGVNGVTEAFLQAVAVSGVWSPVNLSLLISSGCFLATAPSLITTYGTTGIIVANTLSMMTRIACSLYFIVQYLDASTKVKHAHVLRTVLPNFTDSGCLAVVAIISLYSSNYYAASDMDIVDALRHVGAGIFCFGLFGAAVWTSHSAEIISIMKSLYKTKTQ